MSVAQDTRRPHFSTLPTVDGSYEVVDDNGRPVFIRPTRSSANGVAFELNTASKAGSAALVAALGGGRPSRR